MITLRPNQSEPINKAIQFFTEKKPKPSLIVLPTAWGKSILTAFVAKNSTGSIIDTLDAHPERKHILVFVPSVQDAIRLSERYDNSAVIYGDMDKRTRDNTIEEFRAGKIRVIFNVRVLSTGFDYTGIDCIVLGISTASIALYYQIIGRATRIDPNKRDALIIDLGGNVGRFGKVEEITFEHGKIWRMFGSGGKLLSEIPIDEIGRVTKQDTEVIDGKKPVEIMPFGKYKGERLSDIPTSYRQWCLANFEWKASNENLRQSLLATIK